MAYTYSQTKQDEEIAILGAYPYRYEFNLFSAADLSLTEIIVPCKSNTFEDEQVKDIQVTLSIGNQSITETVGKNYTNITLSLTNYSIAKNNTITITLGSQNSVKIWVGYGITAYSSGNSGLLNLSETLPNFSVTYNVNSEEWLQDSGINDSYPYYTWATKQDISGEISRPKPWWVWKIDATKTINAGYPYIIGEEVAPPVSQFQWYVCLNSELLPATPYIDGVPTITYVGGI